MMMLSKVSRSFVACNVYISAGGNPNHRDMLLGLLGETQELCHLANNNSNSDANVNVNGNNNDNANNKAEPKGSDRRVVVVHAFRDGPYDRSSFHLAGSPDLVADVGSSLATRAVQALRETEEATTEAIGGRHPTVGLVDHVSVLPLDENNENDDSNDNNSKQNEFARITGSVARTIGESLQSSGADVLYYGHAHPNGKELAAVRRDSTGFFEDSKTEKTRTRSTSSTSSSSSSSSSNERITPKLAGQATVGAPNRFVENYNIRLRPGVSRRVARTLTESVREKGGRGLLFVEALTLAYGIDQFEVACNLLDPSTTSSEDIDNRIRDWEKQQQDEQQSDNEDASALVETAYRVGTTTGMSLEALRKVSTKEGEMAYNKEVFGRLDNDFLVRWQ